MSDKSAAQRMRESVQEKIKNLLQEFADGKISNEQFNIIYERYNNQLELAEQAEQGASQLEPGAEISTIAIREATTGKAIGLSIYHHSSSSTIETLGNFDVPPDVISPVLSEITLKHDSGSFIAPTIKNLRENVWIVFITRQYTTMMMIFRNEPSRVQVQHLERLHHDFEVANERFLKQSRVDATKLARPFLKLVKQQR